MVTGANADRPASTSTSRIGHGRRTETAIGCAPSGAPITQSRAARSLSGADRDGGNAGVRGQLFLHHAVLDGPDAVDLDPDHIARHE